MRRLVALALLLAVAGCAPQQSTARPSAPGPTRAPASNAPTSAPVVTVSNPPAPAPSIPIPAQTGLRRPRGIYAELHLDLEITAQQKTNPSVSVAQSHATLTKRYAALLDNPAISGLSIGIDWARLNPGPPSGPGQYDWSYLDDAFASVASWNGQNPGKAPKTIQVSVSAGFATPQWLLDQIPSCDGLFQSPPRTPPGNCGKATFIGFVEGGGGVLPMPWNPVYKAAFRTFMEAFAGRYGANPAFVSIDVSGPTAASTEIILPTNTNTAAQTKFGGMAPNEMWDRLLAFAYPARPSYQQSDLAFVDEWNAAIDMFGQVFHGVTLMIWTGDGLPNLAPTGFAVPSAFAADCPAPSMDCAAETTILSHFVEVAVDGSDAKATGEAGMEGRDAGAGNLNAAAARRLSQSTAQFSSLAAQILGGEQFATSAANDPAREGCTTRIPPGPAGSNVDVSGTPVAQIPPACLAPGITLADLSPYGQLGKVPAKDLISPEQAMYNVLHVFFDGTPAAASFGGTPGTAPVNFVQIYNQDITYATAHANEPAQVAQTGGSSAPTTVQDLLDLASQKLLAISEP